MLETGNKIAHQPLNSIAPNHVDQFADVFAAVDFSAAWD
jgi:hypothetical protein